MVSHSFSFAKYKYASTVSPNRKTTEIQIYFQTVCSQKLPNFLNQKLKCKVLDSSVDSETKNYSFQIAINKYCYYYYYYHYYYLLYFVSKCLVSHSFLLTKHEYAISVSINRRRVIIIFEIFVKKLQRF